MVFSSVIFVLVFLPIVLIIHSALMCCNIGRFHASKNPRFNFLQLSNIFLLAASLFFYAWGEPLLVIVMICSAIANYVFALMLSLCEKKEIIRKLIIFFCVLFNLGFLGYYKYMNLFVDSGGLEIINALLPASLQIANFAKIALPLGISFYTFQGMSYVIDVYRKDIRATRNFVTFACYLTMFPQLVAGPIVRYSTIEDELRNRNISVDRFANGAARFIMGLAKKLLIADTLARVADAAFGAPADQLPALASWVGVIAYAYQIYYDFSGYSDMAIGMGHMLGFTFLENFNYPYISQNMREYWRRWHISLSTWFRDYLYIPLGGNRKGAFMTSVNLLIVFALCGLWHGASWIFLMWGLYHGFFLAIERLFPNMTNRIPRFSRHLYVILVFLMGWVLFRADNFNHAITYYKSLMGFYEMGVQANAVWLKLFAGDVYIAFIIGTICSAPIFPFLRKYCYQIMPKLPIFVSFIYHALTTTLLIALLIICLMPLFGATFTPFIYFRF